MVPWAGEFAGKYLTSAVQILRLTGDESLRAYVARFVAELIETQAEDGYLGPWPATSRLTGRAPNVGGLTWDAWGHYHAMLGLLLWYEDSDDSKALSCAGKIGDLVCSKFLGRKQRRLVDIGLDMSLHYWKGEKECRNKVSVFRGPTLLTYDRRLNDMDPADLPTLDAKGLKGRLLVNDKHLPTNVLLEFKGEDGRKVRLCDFGSAGEGGTPYASWLKVDNVEKTPFSRDNPLRSGRA